MAPMRNKLDALLYPGYERNWDDLLLRDYVLNLLQPNYSMLDLGAGAGIVTAMNFRGEVARVCGIDPDARVLDNAYLDEAKIGTGEVIDYPDEYFEIVVADNVLEHLGDPEKTLAEINRVLKVGGHFLFKTPNRFHYMPLISTITPTAFHKQFNRFRGRRGEDTFPTYYRANSKYKIEALARKTGFSVANLQLIEGRPEYLRFSVLTYLVGWAYERFVNSSRLFSQLRVLLIGDLVKIS